MIETMYAAPGVGLAATQVGVPLRIFVVDMSRRPRSDRALIVMINPEFVERDGVQLEEEGCLSVPGFNATVVRPMRAVVKGLDRTRRAEQQLEGTGAAGARVPARDGSSRRHAVRRSPARHQARPDRAQDPEADARRQMVTRATARVRDRRLFRHAGVRRPVARRAARGVAAHRRRRRDAAGSAARPRTEDRRTRR